jgi:hypothetical protein
MPRNKKDDLLTSDELVKATEFITDMEDMLEGEPPQVMSFCRGRSDGALFGAEQVSPDAARASQHRVLTLS